MVFSLFIILLFQNLIEDLKSELGGHLEDIIVALMIPPIDYLCKQLHKAMKGFGTNDHCLIEILCSRSKKEIQEIVDAYERSKIPLSGLIRDKKRIF